MSVSRWFHVAALAAIVTTFLVGIPQARQVRAEPIANDPFTRVWERTDKPVADKAVTRTWMWGPSAFTGAISEDYADSPGGTRTVQYFDKSRMEITDPNGDQNSQWYVSNGLLVNELVTGQMQTGNTAREDREPAPVNVAGDADDPTGPTYATFTDLLDDPARDEGTTIIQRVDRNGTITDDPSLGGRGVTAGRYVSDTQHTIATPFWAFMTSSGTIWDGNGMTTSLLFGDPFYATGLPITEAYWANVKVGGQYRDVLMQCFERRCLTYTPDNPVEWQVEAGNVGQHYYAWRYPAAPDGPSQQANALAAAVANAGSDDARYDALLDVMDAIGIGVYSNEGQQIVGGAERGPGDFYLYDIEIRLMAASLGRGDTQGVEDIATLLTNLPILEGGQALDPMILRQVLIEGAQQSAATPGEASSITPLIVRQLGLIQDRPYDLFTDVAIENLRFDALQSFLILTDIMFPVIVENGPVDPSATAMVANSQGVLNAVPVASDNACDSVVGNGVKETWAYGKWGLGMIKLVGNVFKVAAVAIDAIHGSVLAYSVLTYSLDDVLRTHYGHESPGEQLHFRVKVEMVDELPENVVKCGWLLGVEFPKKGGIKDVGMVWSQNNLSKHGTVICEDTCKKTGPDGIATMIFQPKSEDIPGRGWVVEETGLVTGVAMYQSRHKNVLGSVNQVFTPKYGSTRWAVEYHQIPGYDITMTAEYDVHLHDVPVMPRDPYDADYRASGKVTYSIFVPDSAVQSPYNPGYVSVGGSGSGTEAIETDNVEGTGGDYSCSDQFSGQWLFTSTLEDDGAKGRGERLRHIRVRPDPPADVLYTGNCEAYHIFLNSYTNDEVFPLIDLNANGTQTKTYSLCPATHSSDIICEGEVTWTIKVESGGLGS